jgi:haloalkane dehalogenase
LPAHVVRLFGTAWDIAESTSCQIGDAQVLAQSTYPKLLFVGNPGAIVSPAMAQSVVKRLKNCRLVQLSSGLHYLQEDHPDVIGANIKEWLIELGIGSSPKQKLTF